MNAGALEKSLRETWPATVLLGVALLLVEALLAYVLPTYRAEIGGLLARSELVQNLLRSLLGPAVGEAIGPDAFQALPWVHPLILAILWTHSLTFCSRMPAAEIDRGTSDVLFGLPVSRRTLLVSDSVVLLASGALLVGTVVAGNAVGSALAGVGSFPAPGDVAAIVLNGYCLYLAVGGINYFFSALSDRRAHAIAGGLAVVLGSFLLTFLAQFWEPARTVVFLSLLEYYRPAVVLGQESWPLGDSAVLLAIALVFWTLAAIVLDRRDIATV